MKTVNLKKTYNEEIKKQLSEKLGNLNVHAVPRLEKVVLNAGIGKTMAQRKLKTDSQQTEEEMAADIIEGLAFIGGQRPQVRRARKSIAGFKLREGNVVGVRATLRRKKMYDFVARLIRVALPRTRDFRGIAKSSVDQSGNLTIGVPESSIFPELPASNFNWGLEITLVTNTQNREQALELFKSIGIPFKKDNQE